MCSAQGSISFGEGVQNAAAAAVAAQKAMQEQELAELVSLGFEEGPAQVHLCHLGQSLNLTQDWDWQSAMQQQYLVELLLLGEKGLPRWFVFRFEITWL